MLLSTGYKLQKHRLIARCRLAFAGGICLLAALLFTTLPATAQDTTGRKKVEVIHFDVARSLNYKGSIINRFIGNVQLTHNGALMSCDSAYMFSMSEFEAYGNVVIIKDASTLFGDLLNYNGGTNMAKVRGKIVRLFDSSATLRTQFLDFDTKENIGHFFNGGTIANKTNQIESAEGYYYGRDKLFVFSDSVQVRNETYHIKSEAGNYNTRTDVTTFTAHTNIWHKDGFLSCDYGWYDKPNDWFYFSKNAYIQSKEQEIWSDTVFYNRRAAKGDLSGHIQILDTVQQSIAFGGEGHFFETPQRAMLTRMPSVAYYSVEDHVADTIFVRADTLRFMTDPNPAFYHRDSLPDADSATISSSGESSFAADSSRPATLLLQADSIKTRADSLHTADSAGVRDTTAMPPPPPDTLAAPVQDTVEIEIPVTESDTKEPPKIITPDNPKDTVPPANLPDTLKPAADSASAAVSDSATLAAAPDSIVVPAIPDSTIRRMFAYFNARAYRKDVQAVCDSFAYSSLDSLGKMFGRPVMWNEQQQISANEIHFLFDPDRRKMLRADFLESAFMITHEQDSFYNQVKGRDMIAHFRNNELHLIDVIGGVQTVYYMQEDSVVANGNLAEGSRLKITVEKKKIRRIHYIEKPKSDIYPLDQLPTDKATLKGFEWREAERPKSRWDICTETPRPSQRAIVAGYAKPTFPITQRIDAIK